MRSPDSPSSFSEGPAVSAVPFSFAERAVLFLPSVFAILGVLAALTLRHRLHSSNARVVYAFGHLPAAMMAVTAFALAVAVIYPLLARRSSRFRAAGWHVLLIVVLFSLTWLPLALRGGFAQDDWYLLQAANVRQSVLSHPWTALHTVDTMDGNFRPIGTVLYFGYSLYFFGLHPTPFLLGNFLVGLACTLAVYCFVVQLGRRGSTALAAAILFLSRDVLYTPMGWVCAMGDTLAILFCGISSLFLMRAIRRTGASTVTLHILAWLSFLVALLAKQSAFAMPLIAGLILLFRPGVEDGQRGWKKRIPASALLAMVYVATAGLVFRHASHLLVARTPYPVGINAASFTNLLSFVTWFLVPLHFPPDFKRGTIVIALTGLLLLAAFLIALLRRPALLGPRPFDTLFLFAAGLASVWLFFLLPTRNAAYYESMAVFWISAAVAILICEGLPRVRSLPHLSGVVVCVFLMVGFTFVRIKQTGIVPSGGYIWGTYGMDMQERELQQVEAQLAANPETDLLVIEGNSSSKGPEQGACMALLVDHRPLRIFAFDPEAGFFINDLEGNRPQDTRADLTDVDAYHWQRPLPAAEAEAALHAGRHPLWLTFGQNGEVTASGPR